MEQVNPREFANRLQKHTTAGHPETNLRGLSVL